LSFAIQGIVITTLLVKAVSVSFPLVFKPPEKAVLKIATYLDPQSKTKEFPPSDLAPERHYLKIEDGDVEIVVYPTYLPVGESISIFSADQAERDIKALESKLQTIRADSADERGHAF
jgi:hypothetical protein